ncbi:cyclodeaminase/cyclohydrolase family protein [Sinomonas sp. B1-1]|uniref:cyclodeaminase/cyclohydrolase family protein n=1 Tax=Sinomonas sp. B1-1 TaxID=3141454 RepID=UPI003D28F9C7
MTEQRLNRAVPSGAGSVGTETIGSYLARLASRQPTPGGGAAAALHAAQGAALVARYTTGTSATTMQPG